MSSSLMTVKYSDSNGSIFLETYADMIVYDDAVGKKKTLCAIRLGGYPEQVNAMTQAINGGGAIEVEIIDKKITLHPLSKQYSRKLSHDGVYAEAVLIAEDENQRAKNEAPQENEETQKGDDLDYEEPEAELDLPPRNSFIYIAVGDKKALYDAIDSKSGVPMIPEFSEYILTELKRAKILVPLKTFSSTKKFEAWMLKCSSGDENIVQVVENGIRTGKIVIPNSTNCQTASAFNEINSVTEYLNTYGPEVAERIKNLFVPLFDPAKEQLSPEILEINNTIRERAGYSLYDAQFAVAEAIKRQLQRRKVGLIVAECGAGKSVTRSIVKSYGTKTV